MTRRLENKVVIVSGAGSGLGAAAALEFAHEGAKVVCADINPVAAQDLARDISSKGGSALACNVDVRDEQSNAAMVASAIEAYGRVDVFLANAGTTSVGQAHEVEKEEWDRVMSINLTGVWLGCKAVIPCMLAQEAGSIILQSSITGINGFPSIIAYSASKGALIAMTKQMTADYASKNIRVNAIAPGTILTPLVTETYRARVQRNNNGQSLEDALGETAGRYPMKRLGGPEDIASLSVYLASDESKWVSGSVFTVDGGFTAC